MTRNEVEKNIGQLATLNGMKDLAMEADMRKYIYDENGEKHPLVIEKLTKGGMVLLRERDNPKRTITVPPINVDLIEGIE